MSSLATRLSWALALSLGLNLFLLGMGAARWFHPHAPYAEHRGPHGRPGRFLGPPTPELRAQHDALREARARVGMALEAEPFDAKALSEALAALRSVTGRSQELLHAHLLERAPELSPSDRRALAESRFLREPWDGPGRRD